MATQEKIKAIAEYDGMSTFETEHDLFFKRGVGCTPENYDYHLLHLKYLTSLDWLHPVVMKLIDELRQLKDGEDLQHMHFVLRHHCAIPPVNGEYRDLFNAVMDGLLFLRLKR
jgi:hypothetical protein